MRSRFDEQLALLNKEMIEMGALCEEVIALASKALTEADPELAKKVAPLDAEIDQKEHNIESLCLKLLLQQQPAQPLQLALLPRRRRALRRRVRLCACLRRARLLQLRRQRRLVRLQPRTHHPQPHLRARPLLHPRHRLGRLHTHTRGHIGCYIGFRRL